MSEERPDGSQEGTAPDPATPPRNSCEGSSTDLEMEDVPEVTTKQEEADGGTGGLPALHSSKDASVAEHDLGAPVSNGGLSADERGEKQGPAAIDDSASSGPVPASSSPTRPTGAATNETSPPKNFPKHPPPKTDKPRPHLCTTCNRSFARLEHLKRHERSHTKEKPFECPSCTRCFARRDLLLRHQQKLHSATAPPSRPRNGRRESTAGVAGARVRKNSTASSHPTTMRPRANTLSHIDTSTLDAGTGGFARPFLPLHSHHDSFSGMTGGPVFGFRAPGPAPYHSIATLPRLETSGLPMDLSGGLRTAPPYGGFGADFSMANWDQPAADNKTINPHVLHMHGLQGLGIDSMARSNSVSYTDMSSSQAVFDEDGTYNWIAHGFESQMTFSPTNENAIEDSSPSAMSTNSPATFQDATNLANAAHNMHQMPKGENIWQPAALSQSHLVSSPMSMDVAALFTDLSAVTATDGTLSPKPLMPSTLGLYDMTFSTPPDMSSLDSSGVSTFPSVGFSLPFKPDHVASTASSASVDSSLRHSSVTTTSNELVTDHLRTTVLATLSQGQAFGQRKPSIPKVSSPLSPNGGTRSKAVNSSTFPGTHDLQRYVSAYIRYSHPHLPFLHIPTLTFESAEPGNPATTPQSQHGYVSPHFAGGGGCLMLSMAAIGALYEHETSHAKELFECGKRLVTHYLEGRRKSSHVRPSLGASLNAENDDTPLWLVQVMLLNVIYGHNCGDKTAADIAGTHSAALVSLVRGAELSKPFPGHASCAMQHGLTPEAWQALGGDHGDGEWLEWKTAEERKRTLYAVFVLSSMLVIAYNRPPALTNSEIRLDLPCEEDLWAADSAPTWRMLGGAVSAQARAVPFAGGLTHLLTAAQRQRRAAEQHLHGDAWYVAAEGTALKPSSFGCLVLIHALHNYIWETRQRHLGHQWTDHEVESMHAHIEPALRAWSAAWSSNPLHVIELPNPFGAGPLPADSIPLLDLAYVRLFVDFGRSKEAYWARDYDKMAHELASSPENGHPGRLGKKKTGTSPPRGLAARQPDGRVSPPAVKREDITPTFESATDPAPPANRRERYLRKAAFYAADHLVNADQLGMTYGEKTSRELPVQSALCDFDCAQVLAEWVTTLQERVGKYVGIIGRTNLNVDDVPGILMLDEEDYKLLSRIDELLGNSEHVDSPPGTADEARDGGYGSRVLSLTSQHMARAAVWPMATLMAKALDVQADHVRTRAVNSLCAP